MAKSAEFRPGYTRTTTDDISMANTSPTQQNDRTADSTANDNVDERYKDDLPEPGLQRGVQDVESVTSTWSKKMLIAVFLKHVSHLEQTLL